MNNSENEAFEELNENTTEQKNVQGAYSSKRKAVKKIKILTVVWCIISLLLMISTNLMNTSIF